jgi:two-component system, NarL family, sensor kinase
MDTNETKIYTVILIAAVVLGIVLAIFIISIIRYQRKSLVLYKDKLQGEINTLENERRRIASDLHDEFGPLLSAVKLHISSVDIPDLDDQELIIHAGSHIDTIMSRIREIANNLMPVALLRKGLPEAIREFISHLRAVHSLKIIFECGEDIQWEADMEIHLYRIILEIIQNTIKHAWATELRIECCAAKQKLILTLADNGRGFEYSGVRKTSLGQGLKNIISRVEIIQGDIFIETAPGKGTQFIIEIPCQ